jgi:hypothetical protein
MKLPPFSDSLPEGHRPTTCQISGCAAFPHLVLGVILVQLGFTLWTK